MIEFIECEPVVTVHASMTMEHLCPVKDEIDTGEVTIQWTTNGKTIELHSLAAWLDSFIDVRVTHEDLTDEIASTILGLASGAVVKVSVSFSTTTAGMGVVVLRQSEHPAGT